MNKDPKLTEEDLKEMVFEKNPEVDFEVKDGVVRIIHEQNHPIQKFFRKLRIKIPEKTYLKLDEYGSLVFQEIDGKHTVYDVGQVLGEHYEEANEYLYSRLLLYLDHLENKENLIKRIK